MQRGHVDAQFTPRASKIKRILKGGRRTHRCAWRGGRGIASGSETRVSRRGRWHGQLQRRDKWMHLVCCYPTLQLVFVVLQSWGAVPSVFFCSRRALRRLDVQYVALPITDMFRMPFAELFGLMRQVLGPLISAFPRLRGLGGAVDVRMGMPRRSFDLLVSQIHRQIGLIT